MAIRLDVLVLLDEPAWPGCIIECNVIGVLEAEETKNKKRVRNDRLIATANASGKYNKITELSLMDDYLDKKSKIFSILIPILKKKNLRFFQKKIQTLQ